VSKIKSRIFPPPLIVLAISGSATFAKRTHSSHLPWFAKISNEMKSNSKIPHRISDENRLYRY